MKLWGNSSQRPLREVQPHYREPPTIFKGHILLVEDNPTVLTATEIFLSESGYWVTTATSLAGAVERARTIPELDLLITDYHLSNRETGKQVIAAVREVRGPAFKAVVITGDTSAAVHAFDGDACLCWLRKPIDPRSLVTVLQSFLARPPTA
jgi:two-component system, sensor histidine kinase